MERKRKSFHLLFGLFVLGLSLGLGREYAVLFVLISFLAGLVILNRKLAGMKVPLADELLAIFNRPGEPPGYGAFWYVFGMLVALTFVKGLNGTLASVLMLGVSDAVSTLVGMRGKKALPYNKNKTFEGTLAFAIVSLVSFIWIGWLAIPFSLLGAFVESLDIGLDDNLMISLFCALFFFALA